jgi:hypothetical protein
MRTIMSFMLQDGPIKGPLTTKTPDDGLKNVKTKMDKRARSDFNSTRSKKIINGSDLYDQ